jgi:hypothetical protein
MISVQSHPQRLSGNKLITYLFAVLVLFITSCDALKPAQQSDNGKNNNTDELDPIVGKNKNNNTGNNKNNNDNSNSNDNNSSDGTDIVKEVSKPSKPDTLVWTPVKPNDNIVVVPVNPKDQKDPKNPKDPGNNNNTNTGNNTNNNTGNVGNNTNNNNTGNNTNNNTGGNKNNNNVGGLTALPKGVVKSSYDVAIMLPLHTNEFKASGQIPADAKRSINYYEGMLMGFKKLESEGSNLRVHVYDTKVNTIETLTSKAEVAGADLIIGPVSSEDVSAAARTVKSNQQLMVSLNSSEDLTSDNPYFIQASPSLASHCEAVITHFKKNYSTSKIILLGRSEDASAFPKYQEANMLYEGSSDADKLSEYIVTGSSSSYDIRSLNDQLSRLDTNIIIIPSGNQGFVSSMVRSLSLIRTTYPIIVVGMPRWETFVRIEADYFTKTNVHISNAAYIDNNDPNVISFKRSFFSEYGAPPTVEAYKGYDVALYFGRMLKQYGTGILRELPNHQKKMLHTSLQFYPTYTADSLGEGKSMINLFENKYVHILRYKNNNFVKVNP